MLNVLNDNCDTDYGEGIPEVHLQKLTEPFYRTDSSRTRSTGGFGLGLHIGLHIADLTVTAHNGALTFDSRTVTDHGKPTGTTVTVVLPLER